MACVRGLRGPALPDIQRSEILPITTSSRPRRGLLLSAVSALPFALFALFAFFAPALWAAPGDQPVAAVPAAKLGNDKSRMRTASMPAQGLFVGDQLSEATKSRLTDLVIEALGLRVEMALLVPVGPWTIDGATHNDRDLNTARLNALRRFLSDRGVAANRIYVESQIDPKIKEPRLDVQLVGQQAND
jgi:OOP family OmpA-OmpF porin